MRTGINISLTIWDQETDPYDHDQLAANWDAVDNHDHTSGKGLAISTGAIAANAVTTAKIAANAVTNTQLAGTSVATANIQNGAITEPLLAQGIFDGIFPLGVVTPWFRPNSGFAVPAGFVIATGQTLTSSEHSWATSGASVTIPDLRNHFILGADANNSGDGGSNVSPGEDVVSGSNTKNIEHTHSVSAHSHTNSAHSHAIGAHVHGIGSDGDHVHGISQDGNHVHTFANGFTPSSRKNALPIGLQVLAELNEVVNNNLFSVYLPGYTSSSTDSFTPMDNSGTHNHSGATADAGTHNHSGVTGSNSAANTDSQVVVMSSTALTTNTSTGLATDFRPNFVGLLYIMKVLNT